jgi:DNA-binding LacI/PurR family transcriptional regulator
VTRVPGRGRRPTLADVAALAGVSVALVSIVMRDVPGASVESRRRVLQAADELGYRPDSRTRLLRSSRSRLLGVVFGVQHAFHGDLVSGLYTAADRAGYELALSAVTPARDEQRAVASLVQDRCEALILLGPQAPTSSLAQLATRLPVVVWRARPATGISTSFGRPTTRGCARLSTTSSPAGIAGSPTSPAAAHPEPPTAAAATARPWLATASTARSGCCPVG